MEFKDIDINFHKDFVVLKYKDEKIVLYKAMFQENRTRFVFFKKAHPQSLLRVFLKT